MSNNCLVTKFKSVVNNDNLPILDKIVFSLAEETTGITSINFTEPSPIKLISTTLNGSTSPAVSSSYYGTLASTGSNSKLVIPKNINTSVTIKCKITDIKGITILNYLEHTYKLQLTKVDSKLADVLFNLKNLNIFVIDTSIIPTEENINTILTNNASTLLAIEAKSFAIPSGFDDIALQRVSLLGNVEHLPKGIKMVNCAIGCTGSLGVLVNKFRNSGRTSGKIRMQWVCNSPITIPYNGNEITTTEYATLNNIERSQNVALVWDANTISLTNNMDGEEEYPII